jgi:hypothetical protein
VEDGEVRSFRRPQTLFPEEVDGWRAWSVVERDGSFFLSSLTRAEEWAPGEPFVATCSRRRHRAPGRGCSCGVYAAADKDELARLGRIAGAAIGQVSLWGQVAEHSRGYRAGAAYPSRISLVCSRCLAAGVGEPAVVVERAHSSGRTRLRPLCSGHAPGAQTLPPAGPVEAQLLAAYGVDLMPEATVRAIHKEERSWQRPRARSLVAAALVAVLLLGGSVYVRGRSSAPPRTSAAAAPPVTSLRRHSGPPLPLARNGDALQTIPNARSWFIRTPRDAPIHQPLNSHRHPA